MTDDRESVVARIRDVCADERRTTSLQDLTDDRIEDLREAAASVDDSRRRDTAVSMLEDLIDRRQGKVVKIASFASVDAPVETDGMTVSERETFAALRNELVAHRERLLSVDGGDSG